MIAFILRQHTATSLALMTTSYTRLADYFRDFK